MKYLVIGPKCDAMYAWNKYHCTSCISIQDFSDTKIDTPVGVEPRHHQHFMFDDLTGDVPIRYSSRDGDQREIRSHPPRYEDVQAILAFFKTIPEKIDEHNFIYLHCFAGVSRSTAIGFMLYCDQLGPGQEDEAMRLTEMAAMHNSIWPNPLIVEHADELLGRNGAMIQAVHKWKMEQRGMSITEAMDRREDIKKQARALKSSWELVQESLRIDKPEDIK